MHISINRTLERHLCLHYRFSTPTSVAFLPPFHAMQNEIWHDAPGAGRVCAPPPPAAAAAAINLFYYFFSQRGARPCSYHRYRSSTSQAYQSIRFYLAPERSNRMVSTRNQSARSKSDVPTSAPPPYHSVLFVILAAVVFVKCLPTLETIDEVATIETLTRGLFVGPAALAAARLLIAAFILGVTAMRVMGPGVAPQPTYLPQSKLRAAPLHLVGLQSLAPFTLWCWVLLGVTFALAGAIPLLYTLDRVDLIHPWHLRLTLLAFEISAPCSFLVSTVVKYALWPHSYRSKGSEGTKVFRSFYGIVTHNLNVIFVITEVALLGGLPVVLSHVAISPILGLVYVLFAWWMSGRWYRKEEGRGPQFLYFFLDTTLGWTTTKALVALLVVLLVFYVAFSVIDDVLEHLEGGLIVHLIACVLASCLVCKIKD